MTSLKEKYKKPIPIMKQIMKIKKKVAKENRRLTFEEKKKRDEEADKRLAEIREKDIYFGDIINDFVIREALIVFYDKFNSFQWVWDHQEEVYNATRGKNWSELVNYFESIYQYIQDN